MHLLVDPVTSASGKHEATTTDTAKTKKRRMKPPCVDDHAAPAVRFSPAPPIAKTRNAKSGSWRAIDESLFPPTSLAGAAPSVVTSVASRCRIVGPIVGAVVRFRDAFARLVIHALR